jgi:predicted nucleic acid-binding protein
MHLLDTNTLIYLFSKQGAAELRLQATPRTNYQTHYVSFI